jgi:hypothetical protein
MNKGGETEGVNPIENRIKKQTGNAMRITPNDPNLLLKKLYPCKCSMKSQMSGYIAYARYVHTA